MPNRLAREASPYLRQHGDNPVDWYPWGAEALDRAKADDKPILLSVGYSACHWCHVMAHESFENDDVAKLMNAWFVNVKVDREERPDLDHVYQLVVQLMGQRGGWPLTVFLTPAQKPFFGGTYFPPTDRHGTPGFPKILQGVWEAYRARRDRVDAQAEEIAEAIAHAASGAGFERRRASGDVVAAVANEKHLSIEAIERATGKVVERFDDAHGGFGARPKFPNTAALDLLLRAGDVARVRQALDAMRAGGVWDHLGGGFHRYSTDERWLVPHFEKMLYDNAQLLRLYADAWRATGEARYEQTARAIAAYVAREMTAPGGGFYATEDADSEGEEGKFFVWTGAEVDDACGGDAAAARVAKIVFGVTDAGNFEHTGATVLSLAASPEAAASALGLSAAEASDALERARAAMLAARARRVRPFRDEKILASWNGLMAGALASAGAAFGDAAMIDAGARALAFVERALVVASPDGVRVLRHVKDGDAKGPGFLDDHAFVGDAAIDLYEATGDARWVHLARSLADAILRHFRDPEDGAFFFTPDDGEAILVRPKDAFDHAVPSGAAVACRLLARLGTLVGAPYSEAGTRAAEGLAERALDEPMAMSVSVALADRLVRGSVDVVIVGARGSEATGRLALAVQRAYVPDRVLAWVDPADPASLAACSALAEGKPAANEPVAYVCRGRTCSLAQADPGELGFFLMKSRS